MVSSLSTFDLAFPGGDSIASNWTSPLHPSIGLRTSRSEKRIAIRPPLSPVTRLAVATLLNGRSCWVPTEFAHLDRWTEICQVAQLVCDAGGFEANTFCVPATTAQIWLTGCRDSGQALRHIQAAAAELLQTSLGIEPEHRIPIGCIPALNLRDHGNGIVEALLYAERADESCSRAVRAAARAIAPRLAQLAESRQAPEIQHGVLESERVRARCRLRLCCLSHGHTPKAADPSSAARRIMARIERLEREFATDRHQPGLAAMHNGHVLEGLAAAAEGSNVDATCFTLAARSHAARWGSCEPLARWRISGDLLVGELSMPVDLATVSDGLMLRLAHEVSYRTVRDITTQVAAIGLASSIAYLRWTLMAE
jgi:hydroxymethylglutaryl-CoA reductase